MIETDRPQFVLAMAAMAATFRREATEALLTGYWMGLNDLPVEDINQAVARAMRTKTFMPAVAELRELAGEMTVDQRAVKAWGAFEMAVKAHGGYASVDFDDQTINATIRNLGGWERLCELPASEFDKWLRKDFAKAYHGLASTRLSAEEAAPLIGEHDRTNRFNGFTGAIKPPLQITTGLPPRRIALPRPAASAPVGLLENIGTEAEVTQHTETKR